MVALVDLTGQRFGELVVLQRGPDQPRPSGAGIAQLGLTDVIAAKPPTSRRTSFGERSNHSGPAGTPKYSTIYQTRSLAL